MLTRMFQLFLLQKVYFFFLLKFDERLESIIHRVYKYTYKTMNEHKFAMVHGT